MKQFIPFIILSMSINMFGQSNMNADLLFISNNRTQNDALYNEYSNDSLIQTVKTIHFIGFDTIPDKYSLFKNVNSVILEGSDINGLDVFPLLESLYLIESNGVIRERENWVKKMKIIHAHKTNSINGITSFHSIPLLEELILSYSGFDIFPSDIESLKHLKKIILGVYTGGKIDLSMIDLEKMPLLKYMEVVTWSSSNLTGIPKGIKNSKLNQLIIKHPNLTMKEKQILKSYSKR